MKSRLGCWLLGLSMLAACAVPQVGGGGAAPARDAQANGSRVTGTVGILQAGALPPGAVIKVQLIDVSRADAPAVVLGEQLIRAEGRQPPFAFAIAFDPSAIRPNLSYAIGARIEDGGKLLYINDQRYAVLTRGAPAQVDLMLRAVGVSRP